MLAENLVMSCAAGPAMDVGRITSGGEGNSMHLVPGFSFESQVPDDSAPMIRVAAAVHPALLPVSRRHCRKAKSGVDTVHTLPFGLGRTSAGLVRIGDVFGGVAESRGSEPGSSPTSGTTFSLVRGDFALTC